MVHLTGYSIVNIVLYALGKQNFHLVQFIVTIFYRAGMENKPSISPRYAYNVKQGLQMLEFTNIGLLTMINNFH